MFGDAIVFLIVGMAAGWLLWTYLPRSWVYRLLLLSPQEHAKTAHTSCCGCSLGGVCGSPAKAGNANNPEPLQK